MRQKFLYIFISLSILLLGGCSADEPLMLPGADEGTTLNLLIPDTEMAYANTRAEQSPHGEKEATEGKTTNLTVIGFYNDKNSDRQHFYAELTEDMATEVQDIFRSYKLHVIPAKYQLYVFANMDMKTLAGEILYNALKEEKVTDIDLESKVKALKKGYSALPAASTGLPMACALEAQVEQDQSKHVVVDMKYLCAKVRVTVLYNNAYRSSNKFKIDKLNVYNAYTPTKVFLAEGEQHGTGTDKFNVDNAGTGVHYSLSEDLAGKDLSYWTKIPEEDEDDPLDGFSMALNISGGAERFAYQNTLYIPESVGNTGDDATYLELVAGSLKAKLNLGCQNAATDTHSENTSGDIKRGNFYDIVAMVEGGEVTYQWRVKDWEIIPKAVQLAGLSRLYLSKTEIDKMDGDNEVRIDYQTEAPMLTFKSVEVKYDAMTKQLPLFDVVEDKENQQLVVTVNPDLPIKSSNDGIIVGNDVIDGNDIGFWVISGNIQKWVDVTQVDLKAYLRLLPTSQTVSIKNIANEYRYRIYYDYSTNMDLDQLGLKLSSLTNQNTKKDFTKTGSGDNVKYEGIFVEVCTADSVAVTKELQLEKNLNLLDSGNLLSGNSFPKDGFIRISIYEPTLSGYFSKEIKGEFTATAGSLTPKKAEFTIMPNPTVYTIHLKVINGEGEWTKPHIYVYQPLYYNGYPVYGTADNNVNLNWLEYSFTGNYAFKGWNKDGGTITNIDDSYSLSAFNDGGNTTIMGYHVGGDWGNSGNPDAATNITNNGKYLSVQLVDYKQSSCDECNKSVNAPFPMWPGIGMTKESGENEGWYKIDLPLLVKPGSALVMFADGHLQNAGWRYPSANVPGIPLPDYSDKEAWYLLDLSDEMENGKQTSFSDDRRDKYEKIEGGDTHYLICWPDNWKKNTEHILDRLFLEQKSYTSNQPFGGWYDDNNKFQYQVGNKYWKWIEISKLNPELELDGTYRFKLHESNKGGETKNTGFNSTYVEIKTDYLYLDATFRKHLEDKGVKVSKYFSIKNAAWDNNDD